MSDTTATLVTIPVPTIDAPLTAMRTDGKVQVSLRHACEKIGLDFASQHRKLKSKTWAGVVMMTTPSTGGEQATAMIDRRTFTMWLATIDANRVAEQARPIVEAYQAEAADALDAYFHEGGAINPGATVDQLERLAIQSERQMRIVRLADGIIDGKHLEAKARVILARAMGETPELDPASIPLYVSDYLKSKNLASDLIAAKAPGFGRRLKGLYVAEHGDAPKKAYQDLPNGTVREVFAYTQVDKPLFDKIWNAHYEGVTKAAA